MRSGVKQINRLNKNLSAVNLDIEPQSSSNVNNEIKNNIYIGDREVKLEIDTQEQQNTVNIKTVELLILDTYAKILLDQDVALISNLISKSSIIIPHEDLEMIVREITKHDCQIIVSEDSGCCAKIGPIVKIDFIKIFGDNGEVITDFKQVFNKEYNELSTKYHLNLKYVVV